MKSQVRCASGLLALFLAGCGHLPFLHRNQPAQAARLAPPIWTAHPLIDLAAIELPPAQTVIRAWPIYNMREQPQPIKPPARHRKSASDETAGQDVAGAATPEAPAIGQLSSGDPASFRQQTEGTIASIERGLSGINHPLSDSDQKTADQIREFVKQAKAALASGDVEGAHTLAAKAQILLAGLAQ